MHRFVTIHARKRLGPALLGLLAALAALPAAPARAESGRMGVELNKLEQIDGGGCRAFFLFHNQTGMAFEGFEMSLAVLDTKGIIQRLLTIDAAPLPSDRTALKLFEIPKTQCGDVSEILLHEMPSCKPQNGAEMDCFPILDLTSRASAKLEK